MKIAIKPMMQATLMSRQQWQPKIEAKRGQLSSVECRLYDAIWLGCHSRHIGITPDLAASLAISLLDKKKLESPWRELHCRLRQCLIKEQNKRQNNEHENIQSGLFLSSSPVYVITQLAIPLIAQACHNIEQNHLFCQDDHCEMLGIDYIQYHKDLVSNIIELIDSKQWEMSLTEHALTLSSYTRKFHSSFQPHELSPQRDPALASLLFNNKLDIKTNNQPIPPNPIFTVRDDQVIKERQQSGVSGVMHTHREADLDHSLLSEFLNPRIIRLDRLFNTGFHIIEREPKQEKRRHILIEAIFMPNLAQRPECAIAKACWMHFAAKIATPLRRNKLIESEFRIIQGNAFEQVQSDAHCLADIPMAEYVPEGGDDIQSFVNYLSFYPSFNNDSSARQKVPHSDNAVTKLNLDFDEKDLNEQPITRAQHWLRQAQQIQQDHPYWMTKGINSEYNHSSSGSPKGQSALQLDEFGHVYFMIFSSQTKPAADTTRMLGAFRAALNADPSNNHHVSITLLPDNLAEFNQSQFRSRSLHKTSLSGAPNLTENCAILIKSWLKDFSREVWHV